MGNAPLVRRPLPYRQYNAAFALIFLNFGIFFLTSVAPGLLRVLAMNPRYVMQEGYFWTPFTYMFVHGGLSHILFNMLGLFFFGTQVEHRIGSNEFLLFYLSVGFLAGVFSLAMYWLSGNYFVFLIGASGAVFGVLLAFATYFPHAQIYLFGILPVPAPILVVGYTFIEIYSQILGGRGNVAHLTHLAGFGFAFLYFLVRIGVNPFRIFFGSSR
jgi:membrane associated rhomboid family serine protease